MEEKDIWDIFVLAETKGIRVDLPRDGGFYVVEDIRSLKVESGDEIYLLQVRKTDQPDDPVYIKLDDEDTSSVFIMREISREILDDPDEWEPPVEIIRGGHKYRVADVEARDGDNPGFFLKEDGKTIRWWEYVSANGRLVMDYVKKGRGVSAMAGFRTGAEFVNFMT